MEELDGLTRLRCNWSQRFDEAARRVLTERPEDAAMLREHPDFRRAVPTDEHFMPVLYVAGLAAASGRALDMLADGYAFGSLSMTCYGLDAPCPEPGADGPSAPLPDPGVIAAEDTNT